MTRLWCPIEVSERRVTHGDQIFLSNWRRTLNVKEQLAGKRGACSGCKKVITILTRLRSASPDVEALALEAFAEQQAGPRRVPIRSV